MKLPASALVAVTLILPLFATPASAAVADDALAQCLAQLTRVYGLRKDLYDTYNARHLGGERYEVSGDYEEGANGRKGYCAFNNGHVTMVELK